MPWVRRSAGGSCWPDEHQMWLLGVAWWPEDRAVAAWHRWRANTSVDQVGASDTLLLAGAYRRLLELGVNDPFVSLAGGAYKRTWYLNQLALPRTLRVVATLRESGIETLVLKGTALAIVWLNARGAGASPSWSSRLS